MLNLVIGTNTYISLEKANEYVENYIFDITTKAYWNALTDEQKTILLVDSCRQIESLPIVGVKLFYLQPLQFPRRSNFYRYNDITQDVKDAQVENATSLLLEKMGIPGDGKRLSSAKAEKLLIKWTSGGFGFGGKI